MALLPSRLGIITVLDFSHFNRCVVVFHCCFRKRYLVPYLSFSPGAHAFIWYSSLTVYNLGKWLFPVLYLNNIKLGQVCA